MSDTTLSNLESEDKDYRELDGNGLYFFVQKNGNKSWQLRYKKPNGKWAWLGLGGVSFRLILHSFRLYFAPYFYNSFCTNQNSNALTIVQNKT